MINEIAKQVSYVFLVILVGWGLVELVKWVFGRRCSLGEKNEV